MVFVWAKQETVLAVFKKCPRCLVYVRQYANVFSVGPCLYFINREDRRYTKKMTLANKSAIFLYFYSFCYLTSCPVTVYTFSPRRMKISNRNLMQICTKIRISSSKNRYLVQICTKIRINICTIQKKVVSLRRF